MFFVNAIAEQGSSFSRIEGSDFRSSVDKFSHSGSTIVKVVKLRSLLSLELLFDDFLSS